MIGECHDFSATLETIAFVIAPFTNGCDQCPACLAEFYGNYLNKPNFRNGNYQSDYLNFPNANGELIKILGKPSRQWIDKKQLNRCY
ncbi:hypothetical protein [Lactobacillus kimbladii]|uniref:hypothetical protein n=1 Tax=Lactobacillus kimbladii TaxID=1218506 RepID=UPI00061AD2A2|nr:hypothetical protein [Lactobacillus kimbladii]